MSPHLSSSWSRCEGPRPSSLYSRNRRSPIRASLYLSRNRTIGSSVRCICSPNVVLLDCSRMLSSHPLSLMFPIARSSRVYIYFFDVCLLLLPGDSDSDMPTGIHPSACVIILDEGYPGMRPHPVPICLTEMAS